ncbi:MAG TPA: hypothetical protein VGW10_11610, partial [Solirubrobacteraceae bacterium]|nr:hypothetical protein [Solirubrobacteraceae bacterium]
GDEGEALPAADASDSTAGPLPDASDASGGPLPAGDAPDSDSVADPSSATGDEGEALPAADPSAAPDSDDEPLSAPLADTAPLHPAAGDARTAQLVPVDDRSPELWADDDDSVRILRPRTPAGRRRPARVAGLVDEGDDEVLDPAAVGARLLQPAESSPRHRAVAILSNPRVIVGAIFLLLIAALIAIFLGVGPV